MGGVFILTVFIIGASGLAAQVLLLRELLISFFGNELTHGLILANWLICEAGGVFLLGSFLKKVKNKFGLFAILQLLFSAALFFSVYLSRTFKIFLKINPAESIGLPVIFYVSLLIILLPAFCHGALFALSCEIYSLFRKPQLLPVDERGVRSIGRVYAFETLGTLCGGIILTFLLIPHLNTFGMIFIIAVSNLAASYFLLKNTPSPKLRYTILVSILAVVFLFAANTAEKMQRSSIARQWRGSKVLDYQNSVYGNVAVTKKKGQYTFYYNGLPVVSVPFPDKQFVEDFGNLPLLFHPDPKEILLVSGGAGGLIGQILRHPVSGLDYAEIDPLIIRMLRKYPTRLTESELNDRRVDIKNIDGRFFVRTSRGVYDLILIGLSNPADLSTNRLFTQEFFRLTKKRLKKGGILSFWLPGSSAYLSRELRDLNACILNAARGAYNYVRVVPGDYNIFMASDSEQVLTVNPALIAQRIHRRRITDTVLLPGYLEYRLGRAQSDWFNRSLIGSTQRINSDLRPFALFQTLSIWNKQFSKKFAAVFESAQHLNISGICFLVFFMTLALFFVIRRFSSRIKLSVAYSVFSTGFFGMLSTLMLIFAFQVYCGYLYYKIGILISIFMFGAAGASMAVTAIIGRIKKIINLFALIESLIAAASCLMAFILTEFFIPGGYSTPVFILLFFVCGLLTGAQFPLAGRIYLDEGSDKVGEAAGRLYACDLIGGWIAGMVGGVIFLPVLGLFDTFMVMAAFKLSSFFLILAVKGRKTA